MDITGGHISAYPRDIRRSLICIGSPRCTSDWCESQTFQLSISVEIHALSIETESTEDAQPGIFIYRL